LTDFGFGIDVGTDFELDVGLAIGFGPSFGEESILAKIEIASNKSVDQQRNGALK